MSELRTIFTYIQHLAENRTLPEAKFKDITPKKEIVREYEFKSKGLGY